jgi:bifunctional UDP-N-acetylglucosamine pyrophosphorylase/glucosamine-1-phosphate N-acetyltransferase
MARDLTVLIMAAGQGTRMVSSLPKVLHPVCGRPMIEWVIGAARGAGADRVVCVTRPGAGLAEHLDGSVEVAEQTEGEGTGSAVLAAREAIEEAGTVVVLSGDHPLMTPEVVAAMIEEHRQSGAPATLLTTESLDPARYGRVVRSPDGTIEKIVETKDTAGVPPEVLAIREVNIGTYAFDSRALLHALDRVGETGGERYLTDVVAILRSEGHHLAAHVTEDRLAAVNVNTRVDLANIERLARERIIGGHALDGGVTFTAPDTIAIDATVEIGRDTTIGPGVTLTGATRIGSGCTIGPQATIADSTVEDGATVLHAVLTEAHVGPNASVGPFAYLRPGAQLAEGAKVGTFVEVKNSNIGPGSKVPHLSYVGDADVGEGTNLGASTITANYDGKRKHRTTIGDGVKTGIHTSLVAPVTVGDGAYTGAGSVIRKDVPDGGLAYSDAPQRNIEGYNPTPAKDGPE